MLYHHYAILGPCNTLYYTYPRAPAQGEDNWVLNFNDQSERHDGMIGANYTMAFGSLDDQLAARELFRSYGI